MKYNKMIQDFIEEWEFCPCNIRTNTLVGCFGMNDCKKCFYLRGITQDEIIDYIEK